MTEPVVVGYRFQPFAQKVRGTSIREEQLPGSRIPPPGYGRDAAPQTRWLQVPTPCRHLPAPRAHLRHDEVAGYRL